MRPGGGYSTMCTTLLSNPTSLRTSWERWLPNPSKDIGHLIRNGASDSDYPVPEVVNLYATLMTYLEKTPDNGPDTHR